MAGVRITYAAATGGTYYANIFRWGTNAGDLYTYEWDNTAGEWVISGTVTPPAQKVALSELSFGDYQAHTANLESYTGWISIRIHDDDDASDTVQQVTDLYIVNGAQVSLEELYNNSTTIVAPNRTWRLPKDGGDATNILTVESGTTATLAMDFSQWLNEGTVLNTVSSVSVASGTTLTFTNAIIDGTKQRVHADCTFSTAGSRRIAVTATTTDSQTVVGEGYLEVT